MPVLLVTLLSPPFSTLSYAVPEYLPAHVFSLGLRVAVPLGKGFRVGVVVGSAGVEKFAPDGADAKGADAGSTNTDCGGECAHNAGAERAFVVKPVLWPLEKSPLIFPAYMDMAEQLAARQNEPLGRILASLIPAGLRTTRVRIRFFSADAPREMRLAHIAALASAATGAGEPAAASSLAVQCVARPAAPLVAELPGSTGPHAQLQELADCWLQGRAEVVRSGVSPLDAEVCLLAADPPWPVRPAATSQNAVLEYLLENGAPTRRKLLEALGKGAAAPLATLVKRGLVLIRPADAEDSAVPAMAPGTVPGTLPGTLPGNDYSNGLCPRAEPGAKPDVEPDAEPENSESAFIGGGCGLECAPGMPASFSLTPAQQGVLDELASAMRALFMRFASPLANTPPSADTAPLANTPPVANTAPPANTAPLPCARLLFGITGSGKTAVYLELARTCLAAGRSALLLAPEVALAHKLWNDVAAFFGEAGRTTGEHILYHGYQSAASKERAFFALGAAPETPRLIVGTRSALLLPQDNIGLIVLDEEHDSSFKQDEGFTYQAKEVAWYRAEKSGGLLLLGSATPDVKSFHAAKEGALPLHVLDERVGGGTLPAVRVIPMPKGRADADLLAPESVEKLNEVVGRGEQAVILLNRRGYAPLMYCLTCNEVAKCPHCDIGLAYHKGRERLLCHYCGYSVPYPSPCAACGGVKFLPMGEGTEKMEEGLAAKLPPGTGILRLDRDSTRRQGRMEAILQDFAAKKASVLIGTQMLSKGHHFPDVTLAIIADADLGLNLPDYRAAERTFQLLLQSAGRSGRGEKPGEVLIQTREPSHYCWEYVKNADYEGFFSHELELRKKRKYPPFVRLALIRISAEVTDARGQEAATALGKALRVKARELGVTLLGPAPAPLAVLKGRRRWHCLAKAADWRPLRALYAEALAESRATSLRVKLDLDPVNML